MWYGTRGTWKGTEWAWWWKEGCGLEKGSKELVKVKYVYIIRRGVSFSEIFIWWSFGRWNK